MQDHDFETRSRQRPVMSAIVDAAGAVSLFVLLVAVLHLPIMT